MTPLQLKELRQSADVLRLPSGASMIVRFVEPDDIEPLRAYFGRLSGRTHYNRFLGATHGVPASEYERMLRTGEGSHFAVVAETGSGAMRTIVGEARYAFDAASRTVEFGISIADDWHGTGAGSALLSNLECRAAGLGAGAIFGDALATNQRMRGLARKRGYRFSHPPGDWTLVRFTKDIRIAHDVPCPETRRAAPVLASAG
jgi:RimJ/RimL family protein N-acetyltransferase